MTEYSKVSLVGHAQLKNLNKILENNLGSFKNNQDFKTKGEEVLNFDTLKPDPNNDIEGFIKAYNWKHHVKLNLGELLDIAHIEKQKVAKDTDKNYQYSSKYQMAQMRYTQIKNMIVNLENAILNFNDFVNSD